ncbi:hypothetical protein GQX73_g7559 [Xylaria multiplex]|uniref:F-box domain-containing protein n=1 Tax=Xylaria multiplex TaxID=323545 RepID=A0A7C8IP09_9PEZI|nr:hypothetical protein GQX73_g7559 [Xylaria multiplex]
MKLAEKVHQKRRERQAAIDLPAFHRPLIHLPDVPISTDAVADLGWLAALPNELIEITLAHCTMYTLVKFTLVNRAARQLVHLLPGFPTVKTTLKHQPERAAPAYQKLLIEVLKITPYTDLHFLVTIDQCEMCERGPGSFRLRRLMVLCNGCSRQRRNLVTTWL